MKLIRRLIQFVRRIGLLEVNIYAAYASYFLILSFFPAMMLLISILQYTPLTAADLQELLSKVTPSALDPLIAYMTEELFAVNSAAVLSVAAVAALWASSRGVYSIQRGLNKVYTVRETRNPILVRLECIGFTLLLLAGLLATGVLYLGGQNLRDVLERSGTPLAFLLLRLVRLRYVVTVLVLTLFFSGIYCTFPNRKIRFASTLPGAFGAAVLWVIFTQLFSVYVESFGNYSIYYGSLSVLALAMFWLYACMFILFCGAILNCELERSRLRRKQPADQQPAPEEQTRRTATKNRPGRPDETYREVHHDRSL